MSSGPDGDDDELVDIEIELDGPPPSPDERARAAPPPPPSRPPGPPGTVPDRPPSEVTEQEAPDIIELRQPMVEAAEADPREDVALFESEVAETPDAARRAALLIEIARLTELAPEGGNDEALSTARRAFEADPSLPVAFWSLARRLGRAAAFEELAAVTGTAADAAPAPPAGEPALARADLLVEQGRLYEDRLGRDDDAAAAYRAALGAVADHPGALLSLLLLGARRQEPAALAEALEGLARRADDTTRRATLVMEAALARRGEPDGAARALALLEAELARAGDGAPVGTLLVEIEALTRGDAPAEVAASALEQLARRAAAIDAPFAVALWRERARLLERGGNAEGALAALDEAARLDPTHPLVGASRLELGERLGRGEVVDAIARELIAAAPTDDQAVDLALLHAGIARRAGRDAAVAASLGAERVAARRAERADLRAFELALAIGRRDVAALAEALRAEADLEAADGGAENRGRASALAAAGALRQWALGEAGTAEGLYRRALALVPSHPAALGALVPLLGGEEAADLLEGALEAGAGGPGERWIRATLVSIYADEIGQPYRALPHQRRLVALDPENLGAQVKLRDIELGTTLGMGAPEAETLESLASRAGDAAVAVALRVEAARGLAAAADPQLQARGAEALAELAPLDGSGLASSARERTLPSPEARAELVAAELDATAASALPETVRALRFRLAHHHAAGGRYAEALAALTPLRSEGDPLARAWSYELARRSGEAILEVAVLSEEILATDGALGSAPEVLLAHGEALARAGDPSGAAEMFRRAIAVAPAGPTAAEAALALYRIAAADRRASADALPAALRAVAAASAGEPALAESALREEALARVTAGTVEPADLESQPAPDASPRVRAETAVLHFVAGARLGSARAIGDALADMALSAGDEGPPRDDLLPLLGRAAARARLGGKDAAESVARRIWRAAHPVGLAPALSDLPAAAAGGLAPADRPETRRTRARRIGGATGLALELEAALDAERRGALGTALTVYGSVIAADPNRLEAWTGVRRVARAGGDLLGEARALARLGALVRNPERAAALLIEAADAYDRAGRGDDAITSLAKAVEVRPDDPVAYQRVYERLTADLDLPGRAELFDNLLSHRLATAPLGAPAQVALLHERAQHRRARTGDRAGAFADLKQILNIMPEHRESLYELARGAIEDGDARGAVQWLERFLAAAADDPRTDEVRLELANAYEHLHDRPRAIETLRRAAAARPGDAVPFDRLADLQLGGGDWRAAIEALRAAEPRLADPAARSLLHLRIGTVLRDQGRDPAGAAASFARAAELDPLGDGTRALVALHEAAGDVTGARTNIEHELARIRRALAIDPLEGPRLERLAQFLEMARGRGVPGAIAEAQAAVASVRSLLDESMRTPAPAAFAPKSGPGLWADLADPAAGGFAAEIWPDLQEAAAVLFAPSVGRERRSTGAIGLPPGLGWISATAATLGLAGLEVAVSRETRGIPVVALETPAPALLIAPGAETAPGFRFHVGRALGLLLQQGTVLERAEADELAPLYTCAAVLAGAPPPSGLPEPSEEMLRTVNKAVSRKHRKALALQASRFGFEAFDVARWRDGVLARADRLAVLIAGDVATAALARAGDPSAGGFGGATPAGRVAASLPALDILRFALGERYPLLRRAASGASGEGDR